MSNPYAPPQGPRDGGATGTGQPAEVQASRRGTPDGPEGRGTPEGHGTPDGQGTPDGRENGREGRRRPDRPQPDPELLKQLSRRVGHFSLFMVAALLTMALPLPWQAASVVFSVGAVVVGVRALALAWRRRVGGATPALLAVGVGFSLLIVVVQVTMLALWPLQLEQQRCLQEALTVSARDACAEQFERSITERFDRATGGSDG